MVQYRRKKNIFNFLFTTKTKDMKKIYDKILENKIECDSKYFEKCQVVKELFLNKIKVGMTYDEYIKYKEAIKNMDVMEPDSYIDNIVTILKKTDEELLLEVYKGVVSRKYNCLTTSKRNSEIIFSSSLVINMLDEIHRDIKQLFSKYSVSLIKNKEKSEKISIHNEINNGSSIYSIILKELYIDRFSYLEDIIFKDIYLLYLENIERNLIIFFRTVISSSREDDLSYEKFPSNNSAVYGGPNNRKYYKKR